jgi:CheY-like chemotaxis protein
VLLVEHEDALREAHAAELAAAGFMVLEASDGATAIEKALQFGPQALVLDLALPGIDGFKVARRLRADDRTHDVAIVAMTELVTQDLSRAGPTPRFTRDHARFEALVVAAGCDCVLSKPVAASALIAELLRRIAGRQSQASS